MRYSHFSKQSFSPFGYSGWTPVVKALITLNVACFFLQILIQLFFGGEGFAYFLSHFAFIPQIVIQKYYIWQLFTYMFLHGGFWHLFLNMFVLWMFGSEIERFLGSRELLKFYFICGLGAALTHFIFYYHSYVPVVGASGAIYGLLAAYGLYFGDRLILFMFFFPMRARTFVVFIGCVEFFSSLTAHGNGVANLAHLGGLVIGFIYLYYWKGGRRPPSIGELRRWWKMRKLKKSFRVIRGSDIELDNDDYKWH